MSAVFNASESNFDEALAEIGYESVVLVDFWAEWCAPCKMMNPILSEIASEYEWLHVIKVNVDQNPALAERFEIRSIPTIKVFKNGILVGGFEGAAPKRVLLEQLSEMIDAES